MGKTNPSTREQISLFRDRYEPFRKCLRHPRDEYFDDVIGHINRLSAPIHASNHIDRPTLYLLAIAVRQEEQIDMLRQRIEELEES